jgi:hypothetical protein
MPSKDVRVGFRQLATDDGGFAVELGRQARRVDRANETNARNVSVLGMTGGGCYRAGITGSVRIETTPSRVPGEASASC